MMLAGLSLRGRPVEAAPDPAQDAQILRGRHLVMSHACAGCHSGLFEPSQTGFLIGARSPAEEFKFNGMTFRPPNLTPDPETGLGRYSDRQVFNALRFGLRPKDAPDVEITGSTPGQGNYPAEPKYLAPLMPWPAFRHMTDQELWDIVAYLKKGVKPVKHLVGPTDEPPGGWAPIVQPMLGLHPAPPFPTTNEVAAAASDQSVQRGRALVIHMDCGGCHSSNFGFVADSTWLSGARTPADTFQIGPFITRARNLTPDNLTGMGRFSERQIFNAMRYGLRPGETPDVEITSTTPGQGNFPANPKYLAPPMPWPGWRYLTDQEIRDIAAYLKRGLKPVRNRVQDSDGPPDFWVSAYTPDKIGPYPASPFPTANEVRR
jgi:mono/diheme cytochrome c family protein